ncbi:MAG: hypothetical protein ABI042_16490 [Verrucomicrobiota bacterium]
MFAVIYIPDFFLQAALRHEPELWTRPVALLNKELKKVVELTAVAKETGVCPGLTSTQALARCPTILIKTRSEAQEEAAMNILLECANAFSPKIEATAPGICTLDLQGLSVATVENALLHLWAKKVIAQFSKVLFRAQVGVAENPDLALHAAKIASPFYFVENSDEFISSLSIETIEPPPEILNILGRWGVGTLGAFVALGKDKLAERLGAESLELFERATAHTIRPLNLVRPKEIFEETMEFEHEIETLQPLLFILRRFIEQLSRRLELFYFVAQEIQLSLKLNSGEKLERSFRVPSPTRNIETLFRMLQTHLETVQTDSQIVALHLAAKPAKPEHFQFGLFETALRDPNQFYETLAQLTSLFGSDRVGTPVVENSFRPDAFRMEPVNFEAEKVLPISCRQKPGGEFSKHLTFHDFSANRQSAALCLRRFRPPLPVLLEMRGGRPALLNSEKFVGVIKNASGPFRSSGNWWEPEALWARDEWDIQTSTGELFRVFTQDGDWFLEGAFD